MKICIVIEKGHSYWKLKSVHYSGTVSLPKSKLLRPKLKPITNAIHWKDFQPLTQPNLKKSTTFVRKFIISFSRIPTRANTSQRVIFVCPRTARQIALRNTRNPWTALLNKKPRPKVKKSWQCWIKIRPST
jgi:hypothetical protein